MLSLPTVYEARGDDTATAHDRRGQIQPLLMEQSIADDKLGGPRKNETTRTSGHNLANLTQEAVGEVLSQLGVDVSAGVLEKHRFSGKVLEGLTESEMATVLKIPTLGARRRLSIALCVSFVWSMCSVIQSS